MREEPDQGSDVRSVAADYELHLGTEAFDGNGNFEHGGVHPEVRHPDRDGNPRIVAGFSTAGFSEGDGSAGRFVGSFVALSERFRASGE